MTSRRPRHRRGGPASPTRTTSSTPSAGPPSHAATPTPQQGRVLWNQTDARSRTLYAAVEGSSLRPYSVLVQVGGTPQRPRSTGHCTCPVRSDCKHVAAVLLAARWGIGLGGDAPTATPEWEQVLADVVRQDAPVAQRRAPRPPARGGPRGGGRGRPRAPAPGRARPPRQLGAHRHLVGRPALRLHRPPRARATARPCRSSSSPTAPAPATPTATCPSSSTSSARRCGPCCAASSTPGSPSCPARRHRPGRSWPPSRPAPSSTSPAPRRGTWR